MESINLSLEVFNQWVWSAPLLFLFLGTGLYLTFILKGLQFRFLGYAFKQLMNPSHSDLKGDISPFAALMTSLAGAIGTGTIVGVATAIMIGGLGSIFWMWVTALLSMATKYAESFLAVHYREVDERGEMAGGPMYYMAKGLGWKKIGGLFAFLGMVAALSTGNLVQTNSIAEAIEHVWSIPPLYTGVFLSLVTALVILGGVKTIGHVATVLVPAMAFLYLGAALFILAIHYQQIPQAFGLIVHSAWHGQAAAGGFLGATMVMALQMGVARSVFSNEAGLGISSVAAAAAKTDSACKQALITMTGALLSTVLVCTMTGLVLAVTDIIGTTHASGKVLNGASLAIAAFNNHIWGGEYLVTVGLILFAYTTILAWAYYGEKCCEYLFAERSVIYYRLFFALTIIPGAILKMEIAWLMADISNGLMAIPNLLALIAFSKILVYETTLFLKTVAVRTDSP